MPNNETGGEELREQIEKGADAYMKAVGSVDKKEIIRHDFIEGAKFGVSILESRLSASQAKLSALEGEVERVKGERDGALNLVDGLQ